MINERWGSDFRKPFRVDIERYWSELAQHLWQPVIGQVT